ncbi:nuclease PIN [[Pantoea] beijingensis]|uniref:Nuclease PIN n=1 Tax=[Pantoea] beijingensis TaxID=1324864 RepID=A0A443IHI1_9GAMM|nr:MULTISPECIES: serine/threonine-protein kinase [Erwiniaceae]RWR03462.1 nuclease PIN [[Pantoea] beijingensis]
MSGNENQKNVPNALPAGYRFNEFEIKEVIGGGGFGIVYRAWDHLLERSIAIKEYMPVSLAMRNDDLSLTLRGERHHKIFTAGLNSFIHEARLLARFNHPGLLHVLRFWEENGTAYMGTLYYSGITLKEWQQNSPERINEAWIRRLLPPLFSAINTIHLAGYLHRDISLDNIQIQDNQLPVLLDFGSARKEIGNLSDETEIMLKPGFAPIEQYNEGCDSEQGPWTDIYALGAVLHALVTGAPPPISVVRCIEDNYQPLVERCPDGYSLPLLHAIDRALALQADERPRTIDEFAALINLPVSDVQQLVTAVAPLVSLDDKPEVAEAVEPVILAVNPAAGAAENVVTGSTRRLSRPLIALSALAVVMVIGLIWLLDSGNAPQQEVGQAALSEGSTPSHSDAAASPALATVYLQLKNGENVRLNGTRVTPQPANRGYASLHLAAGEYTLEIERQDGAHSQQLKIDRAGTWLINPGL